MGTTGWHNPCPFEVGGGPTEVELVYEAIKRAVGEGGYAKNEAGIDGLWRASKARALASLNLAVDRAVLQALPNVATDLLPYYEALLALTPGADASAASRRAAATASYTRSTRADCPSLTGALAAIDSRASLLSTARSLTDIAIMGKPFATDFPAYASAENFIRVLLDLGTAGPMPAAADLEIMRQIRQMLADAVSAWVDISVVGSVGFLADMSPCDCTATI